MILTLTICIGVKAQIVREQVATSNMIVKVKKPTRDRGLQYTLELGYNNALDFDKIDKDLTSGDVVNSFWATGGNFALTYKMNKYLSLGVGAGFHFIWTKNPSGYYDEEGQKHHKGSSGVWDGTLEDYSIHRDIYGERLQGNRKDAFIRAMYRLSDKKVSPFLSVDAGYRFYNFDGGVEDAYDDINTEDVNDLKTTYFVSPSIGLSMRTTNNSYFEIKVGYDITPSIKDCNSSGEWGTLDKRYYNTTQYGKHVWNRHYDEINLSSLYVRLGLTHTLNMFPKKKLQKYQYNYAYWGTSPSQVDAASVKDLFDQAYNTPDNEAQTKYDLYMQVIKADAYNTSGYLPLAYNNIGALFENAGDMNRARNYYNVACTIDPSNNLAAKNLHRVKNNIRSERLNAIADGLSAFGQELQNAGANMGGNVNGYQTGGKTTFTASESTESSSPTGSSNSSSTKKKKIDSQAVRNLDRAYDGYETQLVKMKSSGNYSKDEVKSIQRRMKETREKYNKMTGRTRSVSPYETWNP